MGDPVYDAGWGASRVWTEMFLFRTSTRRGRCSESEGAVLKRRLLKGVCRGTLCG
jgi:hypothetical protein